MKQLLENPFYVLALPTNATRAEVEREGQKLIGMLELDLAQARSYDTPAGPQERTATLVRLAMAELRDPDKRLRHEVWAKLDARVHTKSVSSSENSTTGWPEGLSVFNWKTRSS